MIGRADLAQVVGRRFRAFRAGDAEAGDIALSVVEIMIADPGQRQVSKRFVLVGQPVEGDRAAGGANRPFAAKHHALRAAGRAGGVENDRRIGSPAAIDQPVEVARDLRIGERGAANRCDRGQRREATLGIFVEAPRFVVEKMREPGQAVAHGKDLVDLLLVLGDDDRGLGMVKDGGDFVGDRVGVNGNRNGPDHLRRGDRPVEPRPVGADDGDRRAPLEPEPDQTLRDGASFVIDLSPGPGLPEAEILVAESGTRPAQGRVGAQEFREGVLRL